MGSSIDSAFAKMPKLSVIVPFFDIEDYVIDCLNSLMAQTYEDFEIVCVDDGSTDGTKILLDGLAKTDMRVRVLHTSHAGLSEARNRGVAAAKGELVTFVDGDDIVSPWYLEVLVLAHSGMPGRFVRGYCVSGERDEILAIRWKKPKQIHGMALDTCDALSSLMVGALKVVSWACLAERRLYLDFPFKSGVLFEDAYAMPMHLAASADVIIVREPIYGHVRRRGSITRPDVMSIQHVCDRIGALASVLGLANDGIEEVARLLPSWEALTYADALSQAKNLPDSKSRSVCVSSIQSALHEVLFEALLSWIAEGVPAREVALRLYMAAPDLVAHAAVSVTRRLRDVGLPNPRPAF